MKNAYNVSGRKWGVGSLALIISVFAIMFSFTSFSDKYLGEYILDFLRISFPLTIISLILFMAAIFIGYKYKNNIGAKFGKNLSIVFFSLIIILSFVSVVF